MASRKTLFYCKIVFALLVVGCLQVLRHEHHFKNPVPHASSSTRQLGNTSQPVLVVIVSSSPRSGSSFLAEMLSSPRQALLFFEPFWYYGHFGHHILKDKNNLSDHELVERDLHNMLTCRFTSLPAMFDERLAMDIWRKPLLLAPLSLKQRATVCHDLDLRVVKVVRPGLGGVLPLLKVPGLNVHIIQLVRDPRAIVNSVRTVQGWNKHLTASKACTFLRGDLDAARGVTDPRYTVLRYEDLVARPEEVVRRLFKQMGRPLPSEVVQFIDKHSRQTYKAPSADNGTSENDTDNRPSNDTSPGPLTSDPSSPVDGVPPSPVSQPETPAHRPPPDNHTRRTAAEVAGNVTTAVGSVTINISNVATAGDPSASSTATPTEEATQPVATEPPLQREEFTNYYGTIRDAQFDGLHWLRELPKDERTVAEQVCKDVLDELGYPLVYPQERQSMGGREA